MHLVIEMLELADVVKLNEEELGMVRKFTRLPSEIEAFCRDRIETVWLESCVRDLGCARVRDAVRRGICRSRRDIR